VTARTIRAVTFFISKQNDGREGQSKLVIKSTVYWHDTEIVPPARRGTAVGKYDFCIVGAGYTGLWTAYFLQQSEPSARIAVVESNFAGAGASGHNDGFLLKALAGQTGSSLQDEFGREAALQVSQALKESVVEISRFCILEDLNIEFEASSIYSVATSGIQLREIHDTIREAEHLDLPGPELVPEEELRNVFGSAKVIAGYRAGGGLVNPFKLTRALARIVTANGAQLYEATPATGVSESTGLARVDTGNGQIYCDKVVLATDAFQAWIPRLSGTISCVRSYILVSEVLTMDQLERLNWLHRPGLITACNPAFFIRLTWDNRILLGGGLARPMRRAGDQALPSEQRYAERELMRQFRRIFPSLRDVAPEYVFGGTIGVTDDLLPRIGRLSPRISYAYGYCGHGIVSAHIAAKILRDLTLETKSDELDLGFLVALTSPACGRS
jgi:glycine/D-amino acid oxidase-like deaminating enzyme